MPRERSQDRLEDQIGDVTVPESLKRRNGHAACGSGAQPRMNRAADRRNSKEAGPLVPRKRSHPRFCGTDCRNLSAGMNDGGDDAMLDKANHDAGQSLAEPLAELEAVHGSRPEHATCL